MGYETYWVCDEKKIAIALGTRDIEMSECKEILRDYEKIVDNCEFFDTDIFERRPSEIAIGDISDLVKFVKETRVSSVFNIFGAVLVRRFGGRFVDDCSDEFQEIRKTYLVLEKK